MEGFYVPTKLLKWYAKSCGICTYVFWEKRSMVSINFFLKTASDPKMFRNTVRVYTSFFPCVPIFSHG